MRLYAYWRSSASWRARLALQLKGIPYEVVPVHLVQDGGEHRSAAHRAHNPMAQVPVLELPSGHLIAQSLAIVDYLEQTHPEPSLYPADPLARARAIQLAEIINSGIQPMQNLSLLQGLKAAGIDADAHASGAISRGLDALEALATGAAGGPLPHPPSPTFLVGESPGVAELCLIPQLYNARRFQLDVSRWPRLLEVEAACVVLPAFIAAHPDQQPDAA